MTDRDNDPSARQNHAYELMRAGKREESLKEYLWCFDQGARVMPTYGAVRLSFLLGYITMLGAPALQALRERRDAAEERILADPGSNDDTAVVCALNRALDESGRTLALYDRLRAKGPLPKLTRGWFGRALLEPLVESRRYAEVFDFHDDPQQHVDNEIEWFELAKQQSSADPAFRKAEEDAEPYLRRSVVERAVVMYEALVGAKRDDEATKAADALIAFAKTGATYASLIDHSARGGNVDTAKALAERGLASLPESEKAVVRDARERIPTGK